MDWSFFKPHSKYPLLRSDLVYTNEIPVRYHHPLIITVFTTVPLKFYYFTLVSLDLKQPEESKQICITDIQYTNQIHLGFVYPGARA